MNRRLPDNYRRYCSLPWRPARNLARLAEQVRSSERGDYESLLFEGRWHRSGELFERAQRMADGLAELGVKPGDRVVVTMANCPEVGIVYNALWRTGAVVTPAMFLLPAEDLRHVIADAEASAVITTPEFATRSTRRCRPGLRAVRSSTRRGRRRRARALLARAVRPRVDRRRARRGSRGAALHGGTTGRSKGVMLSHDNLYFTGRAAHEAAHVPA